MSGPLHSMRCVCGHWDTEHAAFTAKITPGRTRTFCDHCDCRSWMTPEANGEPAQSLAGEVSDVFDSAENVARAEAAGWLYDEPRRR